MTQPLTPQHNPIQSEGLGALRVEIDRVDQQLLALMNERAQSVTSLISAKVSEVGESLGRGVDKTLQRCKRQRVEIAPAGNELEARYLVVSLFGVQAFHKEALDFGGRFEGQAARFF